MTVNNRYILACMVSLSLSLCAAAQNFLSRLQTKQRVGQGTVVVHQSKEISDALFGRVQTPSLQKNASDANLSSRQPASSGSSVKPHGEEEGSSRVNAAPTMTKHIAKGKAKMNGYRIQVYSGGNSRQARQEAQKFASRVKGYFPELPVYTHFVNPHWICRVGDFRTYEEARSVLAEMKQTNSFREAIIIKTQILVAQ